MKKKAILLVLIGVAVIIQLVPVDRSNPPIGHSIDAPASVEEILVRSCYDCHSNETNWPWYGYVAPVSWLVAHDVHEGREALNFSQWGRMSATERAEMIWEVWEEVDEGEMPPRKYLPPHREARIGDRDRALLEEWATAAGAMPDDDDDDDDD